MSVCEMGRNPSAVRASAGPGTAADRRLARLVWRAGGLGVAVALVAALYWTVLLARADWAYQEWNRNAIRRAVRLAPTNPDYYSAWAQIEPEQAIMALERAVELNDYVRAMWLMLQQETPDDYVIGTGEAHSVREFVELAFAHAGLDWAAHVQVDPRYFRPAEVDHLVADSAKARARLGWQPSVGFSELVNLMVQADLEACKRELSGDIGRLRRRAAAAAPIGG